jgi:predicted DNA-binding transcriptional regulator YafY
MPRIGKERHFEILRQVLAMAEERRAVSLDEAATEVEVTPEQLEELLDPVLFLAFRTGLGDLIEQSRAFLLTEDDEIIVDEHHWLRDLAADPPPPDVALRLLVSGVAMQSFASGATPDLDSVVDKLSAIVGTNLDVSVPTPPALEAARESWTRGRSLRFRYVRDNDDVATDREAVPYRVYCKWSHWYFQGRELDADHSPVGEPKVFRIDRMHDAHLGVVEFDPPPDTEIPDWFDLTHHELQVTLRMRPEQVDALPRASRIAERRDLDDGLVEVDVVVTGERRLDHLLVTLDPDVEVVAPDDARLRQRDHAASLLAAYR